MNKELTEGNIIKGMVRFSVPYLIACFLQTFYGLADLFITGQFNGSASIDRRPGYGSNGFHQQAGGSRK